MSAHPHTKLFTQVDRAKDPDFFVRFMDEAQRPEGIQVSKRLMPSRPPPGKRNAVAQSGAAVVGVFATSRPARDAADQLHDLYRRRRKELTVESAGPPLDLRASAGSWVRRREPGLVAALGPATASRSGPACLGIRRCVECALEPSGPTGHPGSGAAQPSVPSTESAQRHDSLSVADGHQRRHGTRGLPAASRSLTSRCHSVDNRRPAPDREGCAHGASAVRR
jgi:hypothetical protein